MLNTNHPFLSLSTQMAELCEPLKLFGIHHVTYMKQYKNGQRISLSNIPSWIEDYYNLRLYESSLLEKPIFDAKPTFNIILGDYDLDVRRHGKLYYNTLHNIIIVDYQHDGSETYLFGTSPDNQKAIHYLSNNRDILYHFIMYLKDSGKDIFIQAARHTLIIPQDTCVSAHADWLNDQDALADFDLKRDDFYSRTPIRKFILRDKNNQEVQFTQRELACIHHLLDYKTATETAALMNLSPRTVESYIENIKNKLGCSTKAEVINKLKDSPYF